MEIVFICDVIIWWLQRSLSRAAMMSVTSDVFEPWIVFYIQTSCLIIHNKHAFLEFGCQMYITYSFIGGCQFGFFAVRQMAPHCIGNVQQSIQSVSRLVLTSWTVSLIIHAKLFLLSLVHFRRFSINLAKPALLVCLHYSSVTVYIYTDLLYGLRVLFIKSNQRWPAIVQPQSGCEILV